MMSSVDWQDISAAAVAYHVEKNVASRASNARREANAMMSADIESLWQKMGCQGSTTRILEEMDRGDDAEWNDERRRALQFGQRVPCGYSVSLRAVPNEKPWSEDDHRGWGIDVGAAIASNGEGCVYVAICTGIVAIELPNTIDGAIQSSGALAGSGPIELGSPADAGPGGRETATIRCGLLQGDAKLYWQDQNDPPWGMQHVNGVLIFIHQTSRGFAALGVTPTMLRDECTLHTGKEFPDFASVESLGLGRPYDIAYDEDNDRYFITADELSMVKVPVTSCCCSRGTVRNLSSAKCYKIQAPPEVEEEQWSKLVSTGIACNNGLAYFVTDDLPFIIVIDVHDPTADDDVFVRCNLVQFLRCDIPRQCCLWYIAVDPDTDIIYVTSSNNLLMKFSAQGEALGTVKLDGDPGGMIVDQGRLCVIDQENMKLDVFVWEEWCPYRHFAFPPHHRCVIQTLIFLSYSNECYHTLGVLPPEVIHLVIRLILD